MSMSPLRVDHVETSGNSSSETTTGRSTSQDRMTPPPDPKQASGGFGVSVSTDRVLNEVPSVIGRSRGARTRQIVVSESCIPPSMLFVTATSLDLRQRSTRSSIRASPHCMRHDDNEPVRPSPTMSNSHDRGVAAADGSGPSSPNADAMVIGGFNGTILTNWGGDDTTSLPSHENASGRAKLRWYAAPDSWAKEVGPSKTRADEEEGQGGSWSIVGNDGTTLSPTLTLRPPSKKDFWRKTYYDPILVKDDGPFLFAELDAIQQYTVETSFVLTATNQFDQAGIMIRIDSEHWIKTGIEVVDGLPRLSCVVTNSYSDWSTQPWQGYERVKPDASSEGTKPVVIVPARVRVHCRHTSFVVEAYVENKWEFIRICHLSRGTRSVDDPLQYHPNATAAWVGPAAPDGKLWAGIFGACPIRAGARIEFQHFTIVNGSHFDHNAD